MWAHIQRSHQSEYLSIKMPGKSKAGTTNSTLKQTTITAMLPYDSSSRRHKDITEAIGKFIAKDLLAVNIVNREGFQSLLKTIDPRYKIPSYSTFKREVLPNLYSKVSAVLN